MSASPKRLRSLITAIAIVAVSATLLSCGGQETTQETTETTVVSEATETESDSWYTGEIPIVARIGTTGTTTDLNEALAPSTSVESRLLSLLFSSLYMYDVTGAIIPNLAVALPEYSADGTTAIIRLREGLVYSDGSPIVAEDVVATLARQLEGDFPTVFNMIQSAVALDNLTVQFNINNPINLNGMTDAFRIHPARSLTDLQYFDAPVFSGPYMLKEKWSPGTESVSLVVNPLYWRGIAIIPEIELIASSDQTSRLLQVTTGALDYTVDLPSIAAKLLPPEVKTYFHPIGGVFWVGFNLKTEGAISDIRVRKAISLLIDREAINQRAFNGSSQVVASLGSSTRPCYKGVLPNDGARDVSAAKALLAEAGYAEGFEFELQTWGQRPGWKDAALVIAENLKEVGIIAKVKPIEDAVAIDNLLNQNLVAMFSGGGGNNLNIIQATTILGGLWQKALSYDPTVTEELYGQFAKELDPARKCELEQSLLQKMWDDQAALVPISERSELIASRLPEGLFAYSTSSNSQFSVATNRAQLFQPPSGS